MKHAANSRLFIHKVRTFTTLERTTIAVKYLNLCIARRIILSYRKGDDYVKSDPACHSQCSDHSKGWATEESLLDSRQEQDILLFSKVSRRNLGCTKPHAQWVPRAPFPVVIRVGQVANHSLHQVPRLRMIGTIPPHLHGEHRNNVVPYLHNKTDNVRIM